MSDSTDSNEKRVPPDGTSYRDEQRDLAARNDKTRAAGKEQRAENERQAAAARRSREKGEVFR